MKLLFSMFLLFLLALPVAGQTYNARTDINPQPYAGGTGIIPCPGPGNCSSVIITKIVVKGTQGVVTCLSAQCGFLPNQKVQINGNTLTRENKVHIVASDLGNTFTYNDGVETGTGEDGAASAGGALVGAGTVIASDFPNVSLIRVTDSKTPAYGPAKNGFVTTTNGSSETCQFDVKDSRFVIQGKGNWTKVFKLDPIAKQVTQLYDAAPIDLPGAHEPTCSRVTPALFYNAELIGSDLSIVSYDFTSETIAPTLANGGAKQVVDLVPICGAALPPGLVASADQPSVSFDDNMFAAIGQTKIGSSSTAKQVIIYNKVGPHCTVWDTSTGNWFVDGVSQGPVTVFDGNTGLQYSGVLNEFIIHQMRLGPGGLYAAISTDSCVAPIVNCAGANFMTWQPGTPNVYLTNGHVSRTGMGNHWVPGVKLVAYMRAFCPFACDGLYSAAMNNPVAGTLLPALLPSDPVGRDRHPTWANDVDDTQPVCGSNTQDNPGYVQSFNPQFAWINEITCLEMTPPYLVDRITHNYEISDTAAGFDSWAGISTISQTGKFMLMTSDWVCMSGNMDGKSELANCSSNGAYTGRSDVWLVNMPMMGSTALAMNPTNLNFGNQPLGVPSAGQTITVTNTGSSNLVISSALLTGATPGQFVINWNHCIGTFLSGTNCTINMKFNPGRVGSLSANLLLVDNASNSPQSVTLAGIGVAAATKK